jgi:hypothetical protein
MPIPSFPSVLSNEATLKTSEVFHIMKMPPLVFPDENPDESLDDVVLPELVLKTSHKQAEDAGELAPEPLLTVNPHRFVLFPIQDSEVSGSCIRSLSLSDDKASFFVCTVVGHVQTSRSLLLDGRRD